MEIRNSKPVRLLRSDDGPSTLVGYAGVYYQEGDSSTEFEHPGGFTERFSEGAFDGVTGRDIKAGYNHSLDRVLLGRTPDTLRLRSDKVGLLYEIDLPDTEAGKEIAVAVERGDIRGSSMEFLPSSPDSQRRYRENGRLIRSISEADIYQVGPVDSPAYKGTSVIMRSEEKAEGDAWVKEEEDKSAQQKYIQERARKLREMALTHRDDKYKT